jgi:hypothetical protein
MLRSAAVIAWLLLSASGAFAQGGASLHPYTIDDFSSLRSAAPVAVAPDGLNCPRTLHPRDSRGSR